MAHARMPIGNSRFCAHARQWREKEVSLFGLAALLLLLCGLWGVGENPAWAQEKPKTKLLFLIARSSITDAFFERSVVLLLPSRGSL